MNLARNSHHGRIYSVRGNHKESYGNRFKFSDYFTKFLSDTVFIRQNKASLHTKGNEARTRKGTRIMTHPEILLAEGTGYGYGERCEDRELTYDERREKLAAELAKEITLDNYSEYAEYYPKGIFDEITSGKLVPSGALFFALYACAEHDLKCGNYSFIFN